MNKLISKKDFNNLKNEAYHKYKSIKRAYCPYLKTNIVFNSVGFRHIKYRSDRKKRHTNTTALRFKLLDKVVKLVENSHTLQEYESVKTKVTVQNHGVNSTRVKKIEYFGFIGIIDNWKIKVVIKKVGNSAPIFWSVIPNWTTNKKRDKPFKKHLNYTGNLEAD